MRETLVSQTGFRSVDERLQAAADREVVQHPILRQQRGTHIQQFIEDLDVGNPRMLGCQKYKPDRPLTQALAELPHEWGVLANAFINDDPFDAVHERTPPQRPSRASSSRLPK